MGQRIAVISAVHEELAEILQLMPDEQKRVAGGRTFWSGHLRGHEVVAVYSATGMCTRPKLIAPFHTTRAVGRGASSVSLEGAWAIGGSCKGG